MVVVSVLATDVVADALGVVVVYRSALVASGHILHHCLVEILEVLQFYVKAHEVVLEVVAEITAVNLLVPIAACSVSVIVKQEHRGMVLEVMVHIESCLPRLGFPVEAHHPTA